ncbi:PREDICTED: dual serine/threonine and tyrosine protein kinase-like [Branchiostoma belcheri]|uniref:Dual serine/threonine and tyrosine protein kinase-like n=1 Tax=Branchiostoma belcheri TaxID=7741 RepID=A0A6P4Z7D6_BRABE|nr:PREDICTED: dual serine/threonine and tyrosine protein kinase-like [Branchiostoma belcheri]XP_019629834.1 PREDICTED: dual serine/threonine and tyrosine protein kinase-like [Branchiostoma belcheri]
MEGTHEVGATTDLQTLAYLKESLQWCADYFLTTISELYPKAHEKQSKFVTREDFARIQRPLISAFQIVVLGQTNSGKSSVINEILGADVLPVSDLPCTKLPIKLLYSKDEFQQLVNEKGNEMSTKEKLKKRRVQANFSIKDGDCANTTSEQLLVKVGLDHDLLKNGVELIDTPGVGQNEYLDNVIRGVTDGIFQLFLYVIDGNYGLRNEDRHLLDHLRQRRPDAPFFLVCNKVDVYSGELDTLSDDEEREDATNDTASKDSKVRQQLVEEGYLALEKDGTCSVYHGISAKQVRKARKGRGDPSFSEPFKSMTECLTRTITATIQTCLRESLLTLDKLQTQLIITHLGNKHSTRVNSPKSTTAIDRFQNVLYNDLKDIAKQSRETICQKLRSQKLMVLDAAASMTYSTLSIGSEIRRDEVIQQCIKQIRNLVVSRTMQIITDVDKDLGNRFRQELKSNIKRFEVDYGVMPGVHDAVVSFVRRQAEYCYCDRNTVLGTYNFSDDQQSRWAAIKHWFSTGMSIIIGDGFMDVGSDWKREVALDVWKKLNLADVAHELQVALLSQLKTSRDTLKATIDTSLTAAMLNDESTITQLAVLAPQIALELCETNSLLNQLENGPVKLVEDETDCSSAVPIYLGINTKTRKFMPWCSRQSTAVTTVENDAEELKSHAEEPRGLQESDAGAQGPSPTQAETSGQSPGQTRVDTPPVSSDAVSDRSPAQSFLTWNDALAMRLYTDRFTPRHTSVVPWIGPTLLQEDGVWRRGIVTPAYSKSLYTMLTCGSPPDLRHCLQIAREICDAGEYLHQIELQFNDLRVTNVLLDDNGHVKVNNLGLRNDSVPYPDGKPPFHIAPEDYDSLSSANRTCDIYAFGIIFWFMCIARKYDRPEYATGSAHETKLAVEQGKRPVCMPEQCDSKYLNIAQKCWDQQKKKRKNFTRLKEKIDDILSEGRCQEID